jgi:hypothetical protein
MTALHDYRHSPEKAPTFPLATAGQVQAEGRISPAFPLMAAQLNGV